MFGCMQLFKFACALTRLGRTSHSSCAEPRRDREEPRISVCQRLHHDFHTELLRHKFYHRLTSISGICFLARRARGLLHCSFTAIDGFTHADDLQRDSSRLLPTFSCRCSAAIAD